MCLFSVMNITFPKNYTIKQAIISVDLSYWIKGQIFKLAITKLIVNILYACGGTI